MKHNLDPGIAVYLVFIALIMAAAILLSAAAFGQDVTREGKGEGEYGVGHAEYHEWYKNLSQPGTGYSCCSDKDCRPTRAYMDEDGKWHALVNGWWRDIPPSVVLEELAPNGGSHVCAGEGRNATIYCFVGGVPKS